MENKADFAHTLVNFLEKAVPTTTREHYTNPDHPHEVCHSCTQCHGGWFENVNDTPFRFCPRCGKRIINDRQ